MLWSGNVNASFTAQEIDSAVDWHEFVRRREFELLMAIVPNRFDAALELGAGDGGQSITIARYCRRLVCTEVDEHNMAGTFRARNIPNAEFMLCDAVDLSRFADRSFDLVYSSNMLEHVPDALKCLRECKRVVRKTGLIIHTMPTPTWKAFNMVLYGVLHRKLPNHPHGVSPTHRAEFLYFRESAWLSKFREAGLDVTQTIGMPFYAGVGKRFVPILKLGNWLNLNATIAYVAAPNSSGRS